MNKVRSSKAEAANSQKTTSHNQENSKNLTHATSSDDSIKSGTQVERQDAEAKHVMPVKESKSKASKASKRNAESVEKKDSQLNAGNGVQKSKNKKTENGEHCDKKVDKSDMNNGLVEVNVPKEESEEDIKLQIEEDVEQIDTTIELNTQEMLNGSQDVPEGGVKQNDANKPAEGKEEEKEKKKDKDKDKKEKDKDKFESEVNALESNLDDTLNHEITKDKDELANGEAEQSFQNMSFGRTLRKISGRRSLSRVNDRNISMNSSMFVNTSLMSSFSDETWERKLSQYRSNLESSSVGLKRKRHNDDESSPKVKRAKSESDSGFFFAPYGFFQSLRRPVNNEPEINEKEPVETSKSRCLIM